ncbi:hypothetical protein GGH20_001716, partial [Coemansia sp. RSA 1937]
RRCLRGQGRVPAGSSRRWRQDKSVLTCQFLCPSPCFRLPATKRRFWATRTFTAAPESTFTRSSRPSPVFGASKTLLTSKLPSTCRQST